MQGSGNWSPPTGTLGRIVEETSARVRELKPLERGLLDASHRAPRPGRSLKGGLRGVNVALIAEVKRKSPSKGWISEGLSTTDQAKAYEKGGAAAISVLTEPNHFDGTVEDLDRVVAEVSIPVLKKDFHVDPVQLFEARAHGATAALLIARALEPQLLRFMIETAKGIMLETIVEIRDEVELRHALDAGAAIIGINNRNLETLVIDPMTSARLLPLIPNSVIAIAESGMSSAADVERVAALGADAVLVGSSLSAASDPGALVRQLSSVPRVDRA